MAEELIPVLDSITRTFADRFAPESVQADAEAATAAATAASAAAASSASSASTAQSWATQAAASAAEAAGSSGTGVITVDGITQMQDFMKTALKTANAAAAAAALQVLPTSQKGAANGVARLDSDGDLVNAAGAKVTSSTATVDTLGQTSTLTKALLKTTTQNDARAAIGAGTASTKEDVGLGAVNNTSDAAKPISDATQVALDGKASAQSVTDLAAAKVSGFNSTVAAIAIFPVGTTAATIAAAGVPNKSIVGIRQA